MQSNIDLAQNVNNIVGNGGGGTKKPPVPKPSTLTPKQLTDFGNWTGQSDPKVMAADLGKRGLIGSDQLITDTPDLSTKAGITDSQTNWKPAAISLIVAKARELGLRKPEELDANKQALMGSLDPRIKDAINDPRFLRVHPNFWDVVNKSIIPQQWAKVDAAAQNTNNTASNN